MFASPGFQHVVINLPADSSTIRINAPGATNTKFYVRSLTIDGTPDSKLYVPFSSLSGGATLNFTLATQPTPWGNAAADAPPSYPTP